MAKSRCTMALTAEQQVTRN